MPALNSPFSPNNKPEIKNRLFKSAMSEQLGDKQHNPDKRLSKLYEAWSLGGTGLLVTGNVMIDRTALGEPKNVVLDEQSDLAAFRAWATAAKKNGTQVWMQLNHPGKQIPKFLSKEPVAPSAIPLGGALQASFNCPRALHDNEINHIIDAFATSARLAKEAGFDGIQIHGAHGYLVSQFLSPHHNQRKDKWGGSLKNRMRFVESVYSAIRKAVGDDFPVGIKLNSADYSKGGFSHEEAMQVISRLGELNIDLIEISGGTYESPKMMGHKIAESTQKREAYFLEFAESIRDKVNVPLVVTGGFRSAEAMQHALDQNACDMIGLARPLAIDPKVGQKLLDDASYRIDWKEPTTGVKSVDQMAMLSITWYEFQLARMGDGKLPKPSLNAWSTVGQTLFSVGRHAFKKRRA
ncbi:MULTISPECIES: NADH:flavin oxidoreductase/NADH oxidase family protein [unclassified Oleiphilus]|nr:MULTISPECIES: NADH:flavin oxidoreductase/NADH oxidase family protein [unclassified Oleiphilus]KZY63835.1 NADH oxidase [Oleiphilus sp. HI0066]KZY69253.1 NADH oxidase [Oleiphilus sp. HI0067]KZZ61396.1 NADH oxidase [Oleiphilus sp. HI0125]